MTETKTDTLAEVVRAYLFIKNVEDEQRKQYEETKAERQVAQEAMIQRFLQEEVAGMKVDGRNVSISAFLTAKLKEYESPEELIQTATQGYMDIRHEMDVIGALVAKEKEST